VGSIRAIWALQDKISLEADEEIALELKREMIDGHVRVVWNAALSLSARGFDFTDVDVSWIKRAIELWDQYSVAADRRWLEPLIESLCTVPRP